MGKKSERWAIEHGGHAPRVASAWRPIDSAKPPKDEVLLYFPATPQDRYGRRDFKEMYNVGYVVQFTYIIAISTMILGSLALLSIGLSNEARQSPKNPLSACACWDCLKQEPPESEARDG